MISSEIELNRRNALIAVALAALVVYVTSLWNGYAYDDVSLIPHDARMHNITNAFRLFAWPYWGTGGTDLAIYRPLTKLTFLIDWVVSSGQPAWFHFTNMLWHAGASALAFVLLAEMFALPAALAGALVFAVHPIHVEAVANVVGRAEMIAAVCFFGACVLWMRRDQTTNRVLAQVSALLAVGLLAKESIIMLPVMLVVLDFGRWTLEARSIEAYIRREWRLIAACTVVIALFMTARTAVLGRFAPAMLDPTFEGLDGRADRVLTALQAWPHFFRLAVFPKTLLADYSPRIVMPARGWTFEAMVGAAIMGVMIGGAIYAAQRGARRTFIGLMWFPVTILPVSNLLFPIGIVLAERTLYTPIFAVSIAAAAAMEWSSTRVPARTRVAVAAAVLALFAIRTMIRVPEWYSTNSIFFALHRDRPDAFRAHWHMAREARAAGNVDESALQYTEALKLWPLRAGLVSEAAGTFVMQNRTADAQKLARFGTSHWPDYLALQRLLAATSLDLADTATAVSAMQRGLKIDSKDKMLVKMKQALGPYEAAHNAPR